MAKKVFSREEAESNEKMEQIANEVPENRQQQVQQVAKTSDAEKVEAPQTGFSMKRTKGKGSALKQQVISDVISGASPTAGMGITFAGRSVSGTAGGILGANNSTPEAGQTRKDSRVGKKLERVANKLNYTPCEEVLLAVDESKPLSEGADLDQGYNGTYRNEFARSQKIAGAVPGDLMYQRSVDLITKDKLYFVEGQQIFQVDGDKVNLNPTVTIDPADPNENTQVKDVTYHSGDFLHKGLHVGLADNGSAEYCYFDIDDLTPDTVSDPEDANCASAHRLIKSNVAELDRMNIDAKAGDEKAELWSPLARAIHQPTRSAYLMSSIEADTGAYAFLAYSKATTNMAYQLNRAAKDGLDTLGPGVEQLVGWRAAADNSAAFKTAFDDMGDCFAQSCYRAGDPSLMIAAYDSVAKYNNKADLLLQPRGFRMHLQTADNNMNPLRVPKEFAAVYASNETFSTIDHEYDPLLPICMTDKANLITVHNMNELAGFVNVYNDYVYSGEWTKHDPTKSDYVGKDIDLISHGALRALQNLGYGNYHIYPFYKSTGAVTETLAIAESAADADGFKVATISIPANGNNGKRAVSLKFIIAAESPSTPTGYTALTSVTIGDLKNFVFNAPTIQDETYNVVTLTSFQRNLAAVEKMFMVGCRPYAYRYSDLRNKYIVEVKHPLVEGILQYLKESIGAKIKTLIGQEDFYIPFVFSTQYMTLAQLIICAAMPWIVRVRANSMKDVLYLEDLVGFYPYSKLNSLKDVPFKNYVNFVFHDYDQPLESRIMDPARAINWIMPEFFWKVATGKYVAPWYTNENDLNADGSVNDDAANMSMPSIRSGYRLGALDTLYGMEEKDIRLSLDRITKTFFKSSKIDALGAYKYGLTTDGQIFIVLEDEQIITVGDILKAPRELGLVVDAPLGVLTRDPADVSGTAYFSAPLKALTADGTATSYRIKVWVNPNTQRHPGILCAAGVNIGRAANYTQAWFELTANNATSDTDVAGLVFGMGDEGAATYVPFATLGRGAEQDLANGATVVSFQRSLNTRLQYLPFIISPFDGLKSSGQDYPIDIYDLAYYFGLAGFRASDYRESVYNREKEVVNQGLLFVEDPWVLASPVVKEGISSTGIAIGKGYKL